MEMLNVLENNPVLKNKILSCETKGELCEILQENKINLTPEQINSAYNLLKGLGNPQELNEEELDEIAGGKGDTKVEDNSKVITNKLVVPGQQPGQSDEDYKKQTQIIKDVFS